MKSTNGLLMITLGLAAACGPSVAAQVQTEVPPPVPGAKPVTVERVKIHGKALEGNLEGNVIQQLGAFLALERVVHVVSSCVHSGIG